MSKLTVEQKRKQIKAQFVKTIAEIEKLQNSDKPNYVTYTKYLPKVGYIHEIATMADIIKAQKIVNKEKVDNTDIAASLGIQADELPTSDVKLMGYKLDVWDADIQKRIQELRVEIRLEKLQADADKLEQFLSEDDRFDMAMDKLSTVDWETNDDANDTNDISAE